MKTKQDNKTSTLSNINNDIVKANDCDSVKDSKSSSKPFLRGKGRNIVSKTPSSKNNRKLGTTTIKHNDFGWYSRYKDLIDPASQINLAVPFGTPLKSTNNGVPGIIVVPYIYALGLSTAGATIPDNTNLDTNRVMWISKWSASPFNMAVRSMFMYVRSGLGGRRDYDYADMGQMLLSAMTVFATIQHCVKALALVKKYSLKNRFLGQALVEACGFNYNDLISNYITYVTRINLLIRRASVIKIPNGLSVLERWVFLNSNIFKDNDVDSERQQYIIYRPEIIYRYEESSGECIAESLGYGYTRHPSTQIRMAGALETLERAITKLWSSETFQIMMGDIDRAYNHDVVGISPIEGDVNIEPIYSLELALQMQNANCLMKKYLNRGTSEYEYFIGHEDIAAYVAGGFFNVGQERVEAENNQGCLYYQSGNIENKYMFGLMLPTKDVAIADQSTVKQATMTCNKLCDYSLINTYVDNPSAEIVVYATRHQCRQVFVSLYGSGTANTHYRKVSTDTSDNFVYDWIPDCGTELIICYELWRSNEGGFMEYYALCDFVEQGEKVSNNDHIAWLSNFALCPRVFYYSRHAIDDVNTSYRVVVGDLLSPQDLDWESESLINNACIYSLWLVPSMSDGKGQVGFAKYMVNK